MSDLIVHAGGWNATPGDLASVALPEETASYRAVPYPRLIEEVKLHVPRFGLSVEREDYALARDGNQMFGVLTCKNGVVKDYALAIGIRSSYDRSLAVDLVAGSRVFVCDNLAFSGEAQVSRKHTVNVFRDLPDLIYQMLNRVSVMKQRQDEEIDLWKQTRLGRPTAHHLMVESVRQNALPASKLPKVIEQFDSMVDNPEWDDSAWSLFNAFTFVIGQQQPWQQMDNTLRLSHVFREALA